MEQLPTKLPVLPIRNAVLFPAVSLPLIVGRPRSIKALERAESKDNLLVIVTQKVITSADPSINDLYSVGTLCRIEDTAIMDNGSRQVVVTGLARYRLAEVYEDSDSNLLLCR